MKTSEQVLSDREATAARIAALRQEERTAMPALQKAEDDAAARLEEARRALEAAERELNVAAGARSIASLRCSDAISKLEGTLRETADPAIRGFVLEFDKLWESLRAEPAEGQRVAPDEIDLRGFRHPGKSFTDYYSRLRRLAAIRAAQIEVRDVVALEIHTAESLGRRLQQLRDSLPAIKLEPPPQGAPYGLARASA